MIAVLVMQQAHCLSTQSKTGSTWTDMLDKHWLINANFHSFSLLKQLSVLLLIICNVYQPLTFIPPSEIDTFNAAALYV